MKTIQISKNNYDTIVSLRREHSLQSNNEVISLLLIALEQYGSKYGPIDIDDIYPVEVTCSNSKDINSEVL